MSKSQNTLDGDGDQLLDQELDRELDEALKMTFPASDPVAIAAPGSTSRIPDSPSQRDRAAAAKPAQRADRSARRKP
jgi:hypothetical protein